MWTTPVTPTTSSRPSLMLGFLKRPSTSDPHRSAPDPQLDGERKRSAVKLRAGVRRGQVCVCVCVGAGGTWGC